jgi:hypothetical protein
MRSPAEINFRLNQETKNLLLLASPPKYNGPLPRSLSLPDPRIVAGRLFNTSFRDQITVLADQIVKHRFRLLGFEIETGPEIRWRRDYVHNIESGIPYFRRLPYLDFHTVGDHKNVWELNRHQHLVVLAQAFLFTGRREYIDEIIAQLESWFEQNPFQRGINWASALEVAFRALSWIWTWHIVATELPETFLRHWANELYRHAHHLAANLSVYFSPNTHLLGEAVALHAISVLFASFPQAAVWKCTSSQIVDKQLSFQVWPDGAHFEQSSYYHVYALDFFVLHFLLSGRPDSYRPVLEKMAGYIHWLLGPSRKIAFLGDDDGGRLFHPYGDRHTFGRASLATCGILLNNAEWLGTTDDVAEQALWWLDSAECRAASQRSAPSGNQMFANAGAAFLQTRRLFVQMDAGPFGYGGAGHSHSDALSILVWLDGEPVFIDPGTFTYVGDPAERDWFRGSAAHNTIRIDELDQGIAAGPFRWSTKPSVHIDRWEPSSNGGVIEATCSYSDFVHRRRVLLSSERLLVLDEISGDDRHSHRCEQIWQLGPAASRVQLSFSAPTSQVSSKLSPAYGAKRAGTALVSVLEGSLPLEVAFLLDVNSPNPITVAEARRVLEMPQ